MTDNLCFIYITMEGGNIITIGTTQPSHVFIADYDNDATDVDDKIQLVDGADTDLITLEEYKEWVADAREEKAKGEMIGPLTWYDIKRIYSQLTDREPPGYPEMYKWCQNLPGLFYTDKQERVWLRKRLL